MSKRNAIRIMSLAAALLVVIIGMAIKNSRENNYYELQLENEYSRAVEELTAGVNNISLLLKKSKYSGEADTINSLAGEIIAEAQISKNALSRMPTQSQSLTGLNKFLSQVGNYTLFLSKSLSVTGTLSKEQRENMENLSDTAEKISDIINDAGAKFNNIEYWSKEINKALPEENISSSLSTIEDELSDYPTLIYDGPYSDHILEKQALMTAEAFEVTEDKAKQVALKTIGSTPEDLKLQGTAKGHIDTFVFGNDWVSVSVSRFGGYPVYMRKTRQVTSSNIDYNQAVKKAKRYLDEIGITDMTETYYYTDEGICVINFAFVDGQTICYTDLIKVGVAMDTGEIMLYEASGYLTNHKTRAFQSPAHTEEEAKQLLNTDLTVRETAIALIPTDGEEKRCYEFLCSGKKGEEILVYINVSTLKEEEILILLKEDGGTLVK